MQRVFTSLQFGRGSNSPYYLHDSHVRLDLLFHRNSATLEVSPKTLEFFRQGWRRTTCYSFAHDLKRMYHIFPVSRDDMSGRDEDDEPHENYDCRFFLQS